MTLQQLVRLERYFRNVDAVRQSYKKGDKVQTWSTGETGYVLADHDGEIDMPLIVQFDGDNADLPPVCVDDHFWTIIPARHPPVFMPLDKSGSMVPVSVMSPELLAILADLDNTERGYEG